MVFVVVWWVFWWSRVVWCSGVGSRFDDWCSGVVGLGGFGSD